MTARRIAVVIDAADVDGLRDFWVAALGYEPSGKAGRYRSATPPDGTDGPKFVFQQVPEPPPTSKNRLHVDIVVGDDVESEAIRLERIGARRLTGVVHEVGTSWIVMADPEGNEFCLVHDT
jgi:predicted enzyme related to lactoylglutathione lyase